MSDHDSHGLKCPRCGTRLGIPVDPTESGCPECLWVPTDAIEHFSRAMRLAAALPGGKREEMLRSLACQGQGAAFALAQVGFITQDQQMDWLRRLYETAGIDLQEIRVEVKPDTVEGEDDH